MATQGQVDAFVLEALGTRPEIKHDQIIGFAMLEYNIFYDVAKRMVEISLPRIKGKAKTKGGE